MVDIKKIWEKIKTGPFERNNVKYFNPRLINKDVNIPTTYLCYKVVEQDLWIAMVGCIADYHMPDFFEDFKTAGTLVFGISKDTLKSHEQFKTQHNLPFELISDTDAYLCRMFEVIKPINMYGKQIQGVERSTFLIDSKGVL